jgi:hypothetical protein
MNRLLGSPPDDLAREKIEDHGEIEPTLPGSDIGDVRDPCLVGSGHRELTLQSIRNQRLRFSYGDVANAVAMQCLQSILSHQTSNPMLAARLSTLAKIVQDSRRTIDAVAGGKRCANESQQPSIFLCSITDRLLEPGVIPGWRHAEKSTHRANAELSLMRFNEFIGPLGFAQHVSCKHGAHLKIQMLDLSTKSWELQAAIDDGQTSEGEATA